MSYIKEILKEELERNRNSQKALNLNLQQIQHGSLIIRNNKYIYLNYRKDNKVCSEYLGKVDEVDVEKVRGNNEKYKYYKNNLKELKKEEKSLIKAIKNF